MHFRHSWTKTHRLSYRRKMEFRFDKSLSAQWPVIDNTAIKRD